MPIGPDTYTSMTALYDDPGNVEGTTYAKRWKRHEWSQTVEEQPTDNAETQAIVMAIHGGGIEKGTSEIALATAGYHPSRFPLSMVMRCMIFGCSKACCHQATAGYT